MFTFLFIFFILFKLIKRILFKNKNAIAFFHPYANAGGGGEVVLWKSIEIFQNKYPDYEYYIYTGDTIDEKLLVENVKKHFGIVITKPLKIIKLRSRFLVEAKYYPMFTLLGQSLGSIILAFESIYKLNPFIVLDTMGYVFTHWVFKLLCCKVFCYNHYPTISYDMLNTVNESVATYNNRKIIANNKVLTSAKLIYYQIFAQIYRLFSYFADVIVVNSSWTKDQLNKIWKRNDISILYPPFNLDKFSNVNRNDIDRNKYEIISVAQFRPEKNHKMQLDILSKLLEELDPSIKKKVKLSLVGSTRNEEDEKRVKELKEHANNLKILNNVEFCINYSLDDLLKIMSKSSISIHTMFNEHFGIAIVESMAAGLIQVANNSGGPKLDIIDHEENGYLASTIDEYVEIIKNIFNKHDDEVLRMRKEARNKTKLFSDLSFDLDFIKLINAKFLCKN